MIGAIGGFDPRVQTRIDGSDPPIINEIIYANIVKRLKIKMNIVF